MKWVDDPWQWWIHFVVSKRFVHCQNSDFRLEIEFAANREFAIN
jgi:hypothetical protein